MGNIPMLTQEEEIELTKKVAEGNEKAKEQLIEANLRLVVYTAKKYIAQHATSGCAILVYNISYSTVIFFVAVTFSTLGTFTSKIPFSNFAVISLS